MARRLTAPGRAVVRGLPFALAAVLACTPAPPETISRQDFVTVFVELRKAEISSRDAVISEQARDSVLTAHGVSQDDMLAFAGRARRRSRVHGGGVVRGAGADGRLHPGSARGARRQGRPSPESGEAPDGQGATKSAQQRGPPRLTPIGSSRAASN